MRAFVIAFLLALFATPSFASDRKVEDFYGAYLGHGEEVPLAESDKQKRTRFSQVIIRPAKEEKAGFTIEWSTMKLKGDELPAPVDTKTYALTFRPTDQPNVYRDVQTDPKENEASWAVISNGTLSIIQVSVAPDGGFVVGRYDRKLTPKGMDVRFTRVENGKLVRSVKLNLLKGPAKVN